MRKRNRTYYKAKVITNPQLKIELLMELEKHVKTITKYTIFFDREIHTTKEMVENCKINIKTKKKMLNQCTIKIRW